MHGNVKKPDEAKNPRTNSSLVSHLEIGGNPQKPNKTHFS
jgi:hypothetical protein